MMRHIVGLLTPFGRMQADTFPLLFVPVVTILMAVHLHVDKLEVPYGPMLGVLLALIWVKYCIMSRRLQDCGYRGAIYLLPMFLLATWWLLAFYDPSFDSNFFSAPVGSKRSAMFAGLCTVREYACALMPAVWIYCVIGSELEEQADHTPVARLERMRLQTGDDGAMDRSAEQPGQVFGRR